MKIIKKYMKWSIKIRKKSNNNENNKEIYSGELK